MDNFFAPTPDDIKEAQNGGRPEFAHGEVVGFLIDEVSEKVDDKGEKYLIVGTKVTTGDNDGKRHPFFIRSNPTSKGIWINMLKAFYDDATIASGSLTPVSLVGKMLESKASVSAKGDKVYTNFYEFTELGGAPTLGQAPEVSSSDIPF